MTNSAIGKILVVDDEVELKNILVEALTSQGFETAGFTAGEDRVAATHLQEERGTIIGFEFQGKRKDGQTIWLSLRS